jgi:hypothetical protein
VPVHHAGEDGGMSTESIITVKTPLPADMSYKCKCGYRVSEYTSYQNGAYYLFHCWECGRIRRFTDLVNHCEFCGIHQKLNDGMMHEYGNGLGDFWMCSKCANDGTFDAHVKQCEKDWELCDNDYYAGWGW